MECSELQNFVTSLGVYGVGIVVGAGVVYLIFRHTVASYLQEKGKNLATREDIESITDTIELVKTGYAKVLEEVRSGNQLRLAEIERQKSIKKEVFLDAIEALTRSQNVIASLMNLSVDEHQISQEMARDAGLIANVQVVGSAETVRAVTTLMASIETAMLGLTLDRGLLVQRLNSIHVLEDLRKKAEKEIDRYIAMMKGLNLDGNDDRRLLGTLKNQLDFEKNQRDQFGDEIARLLDEQNSEHLVFTQKCLQTFFEILSLLPDVVLSIRRELDLPISDDAYLKIFNENVEQGKKVFGAFFDRVKSPLGA